MSILYSDYHSDLNSFKQSMIERVLLNTDISISDSTYIGELVLYGMDYITSFCSLKSFPYKSKGYSISDKNAETNLASLNIENASFLCSVNGSSNIQIAPIMSSCIDGTSTANELERAIHSNSYSSYFGFNEVNVTFDSSNKQYFFESGRYGCHSAVNISFFETQKDLCCALKIGSDGRLSFSGYPELKGNDDDLRLQNILVQLVVRNYHKKGMEGMASGGIAGVISFTCDKEIDNQLLRFRRLR